MQRSVTALSRQLERDLDWRFAELAIIRELLSLHAPTTVRTSALFRSAWLLLYAHYEGFCKFGLQLYAEFLGSLPSCDRLAEQTFIHVHQAAIRAARQKPASAMMQFFRHEVDLLRVNAPPVIEVDTRSNLWPDLLKQLLFSFDIDASDILVDEDKIKALVGRRNDIAHGRQVFISNLGYYTEYEKAAQNVMYALALAIVEKADEMVPTGSQ